MGERKGQNKWYPPDFDPRKHKSLDSYYGTHALRERARKLDKGILIIRFEMPYDIWCGGCGIHIAQSVRYNAEKSKMGMYYTTPIWKFRMRCHLCPQYFEIKTDPANHDYVIISGARRKEKRWDPKENEQIVPDDKSDIKKMSADAMFKLEHGTDDKAKLKAKMPGLAEIEDAQSKWKDDYLLNQLARQKFRTEKKQIKAEAEEDLTLLKKSSLDIELVKEHEDDVRLASLMKYNALKTFDERKAEKRQEIDSRPLFQQTASQDIHSPSASTSATSGSNATDKTAKLQKVALTKMKLGIKQSKMQTDAFKASPHEGKIKQLTTSSVGIVRKKNKMYGNETCRTDVSSHTDLCDAKNAAEAMTSASSSTETSTNLRAGGSSFGGNSDAKQIVQQNIDDSSREQDLAKSAGLGSLIANYESSSCESD